MEMLPLQKDSRCFVCGPDNPDGFGLKVEHRGDGIVRAVFVAESRYKGWSSYLHGGVVSLIFDELLGWTAYYLGYIAMTARLEIRYRKPVFIGQKLLFTGKPTRMTAKVLDIETVASLMDGPMVAQGKGRMMILGKRQGFTVP